MAALRPFRPADLPALFALDQACFRPGIAYSRAELRYFLTHARCFSVVAEEVAEKSEDGPLAGFAVGEVNRESGKVVGHIITIDVSPEHRRSGVGRQLLLALEADMTSRGALSVRLEVAADNETAQRFYESMGYQRTGRIPAYYLSTLDALVMEKPLPPGPGSTSGA